MNKKVWHILKPGERQIYGRIYDAVCKGYGNGQKKEKVEAITWLDDIIIENDANYREKLELEG